MRRFSSLSGLLAVVLCPVLLAAQQEGPANEQGAAGSGGAMEMPQPAAEMAKLDWMVGDWSVTETHEKTPWSAGGTGQGTMEIERGPGGFTQIMDYESSGPMGPFQGHAIMAWDPQAKVYRIAWSDNMTPGIVMSECREEGKDLVCEGGGSMAGQQYSMRSRATNPGPQGWTEVFEMSVGGAPFQKTMTLEYEPAS